MSPILMQVAAGRPPPPAPVDAHLVVFDLLQIEGGALPIAGFFCCHSAAYSQPQGGPRRLATGTATALTNHTGYMQHEHEPHIVQELSVHALPLIHELHDA